MKRILRLLIFACMSVSMSLAGYSDGWITAGEYEGHVRWTSNTQPLIVDGGGAASIEMRNYSQLEVRSTSTPLGLLVGGIQYIFLDDNSHLDYYSGETFNLDVVDNATADLYGGRIDIISSLQHATTKHINIYALPGWSWLDDDPLKGIQGQWWNGETFRIEFVNETYWPWLADPVWMNINVIVPEPATLLLMTLGCILIRKR